MTDLERLREIIRQTEEALAFWKTRNQLPPNPTRPIPTPETIQDAIQTVLPQTAAKLYDLFHGPNLDTEGFLSEEIGTVFEALGYTFEEETYFPEDFQLAIGKAIAEHFLTEKGLRAAFEGLEP